VTTLSNQLQSEEKDYYKALKTVVKKHGKFNDDNNVWIGYIPAIKNQELSIGVSCKNCAFYLGNGKCEIVDNSYFPIEDNGHCRLAAIPDNLINKSDNIYKLNSEIWNGVFSPTIKSNKVVQ
jgi:hypothetical protein